MDYDYQLLELLREYKDWFKIRYGELPLIMQYQLDNLATLQAFLTEKDLKKTKL